MRLWPLIPLPIFFAACLGEANQPNNPPVDGSEFQIVESSSPQWLDGQAWSVADSSELDLSESGTGPAHEFERVTDGIRLDDGRVAVADDGWREIRFFSPSGEFIASVGRDGEGPGEFRRIRAISPWRGDSIAVFDQMLNRVTILSQRGGVRTIPLTGLPYRPENIRALGDSAFIGLFSPSAFQPAQTGAYRIPYSVVRLDAEGVAFDTLTTIGGSEGYAAPGLSGPLLVAKNGHLAARNGDAVFGAADVLEYERYREGIGQIQKVTVPSFDLTLSAGEVEDIRQRVLSRQHPPDVRRAYEAMPLPGYRPAYSQLLIDAEGCVWAAGYRLVGEPEGPRDWQVFDSSGNWLGQVRIPARFTPFDIGGDFVLGVWRDAFDVHHVQIRALVRTLG